MIRSATFDSTSKIYNPSAMIRQFKTYSPYQTIDHNAYCSPSERIGRLYTMSAASLGMGTATYIAKNGMNSGGNKDSKVVGFSLAVTAPDAFEATNRITKHTSSHLLFAY